MLHLHRVLSCVPLALLLFPLAVRAGINQWTTNGPPGGVRTLAMDPGPAGTLYASNGDGIYRSSDLAQSWTLISPVARTVQPLDFLKVDPVDPMTLYGFTNQLPFSGFRRSRDGGVRWQMLSQGLPTYARQLEALPGAVYLVSDGIYKSEDSGSTWTLASATSPPGTVVFDPQNPQQMYAGGDQGFFRSTDGGQSWNRPPRDLFQAVQITSVVVDPANFSRVYIGIGTEAQSAIFESADSGETWSLNTAGLDGYGANVLIVVPGNPSILYARWGSRQ